MSNSLTVVKEISNAVAVEVRGYVSQNSLQLPANYSVENALKAAALMLPEVKGANKIPALQSCTLDSIKSALLSMCVQGLNPDKKQCYFIAYGERLTLSRSYFGDIAVAKQVDPNIDDIYPAVVFEGDKFDYEIKRGKIVEIHHSQKLENKNHPIVAAYATVVYKDGHEISTVMTIEQIKQAWKHSQMNPINDDGTIKASTTHGKYPEEMAKKTVIHRACKAIIDTSDDSSLVVKYSKQCADDASAAEVEQEISENANKEFIEADAREVEIPGAPDAREAPNGVDPETGEVIDAKEEEPF